LVQVNEYYERLYTSQFIVHKIKTALTAVNVRSSDTDIYGVVNENQLISDEVKA